MMGNNDALKDLVKFKAGPAKANLGKRTDRAEVSGLKGVGERDELELKEELEAVKEELSGGPELAIRKNWEVFQRKFEVQLRDIMKDVGRMVHHEGDRVIAAITSGPHERIFDPVSLPRS